MTVHLSTTLLVKYWEYLVPIVLGVWGALQPALFKFIASKLLNLGRAFATVFRDSYVGFKRRSFGANSTKKFAVLFATLARDPDGSHTIEVERPFMHNNSFERLTTKGVLEIGATRLSEEKANLTALKWLRRFDADLLIYGEVVKTDQALRLWFVDRYGGQQYRKDPFLLTTKTLGEDYKRAANLQLVAAAMAAIKPATTHQSEALASDLETLVGQFESLLSGESKFSKSQLIELHHGIGIVLLNRGSHIESGDLIDRAIEHFESVLRLIDRSDLVAYSRTKGELSGAYLNLVSIRADNSYLQKAAETYESASPAYAALPAGAVKLFVQFISANILYVQATAEPSLSAWRAAKDAFTALVEVDDFKENTKLWLTAKLRLGRSWAAIANMTRKNNDFISSQRNFFDVLDEVNSKTNIIDWSVAKIELASLYQVWSTVLLIPSLLDEANDLLQEVVDSSLPKQAPGTWTRAKLNLAVNMVRIARRDNDFEILGRAIEIYQSLIVDLAGGNQVANLAHAYLNLGDAYLTSDALEVNSTHTANEKIMVRLHAAVEALEKAIALLQNDRGKNSWGNAHNSLGSALHQIGRRTPSLAALERADKSFEATLLSAATKGGSLDWVAPTRNRGGNFLDMARVTGSERHYELAIEHMRVVLMEFEARKDKEMVAETQWLLADALFHSGYDKHPERLTEASQLMEVARPIMEGKENLSFLALDENIKAEMNRINSVGRATPRSC